MRQRRCSRTYVLRARCQRCGKALTRQVHLPPWTGIFCADCCPVCHPELKARWAAGVPEAVTTKAERGDAEGSQGPKRGVVSRRVS